MKKFLISLLLVASVSAQITEQIKNRNVTYESTSSFVLQNGATADFQSGSLVDFTGATVTGLSIQNVNQAVTHPVVEAGHGLAQFDGGSYAYRDISSLVTGEINDAISGKTTANAPLFTTINHSTATYVRSLTSWPAAAGVDLSCISVWNSGADVLATAVLISPRHVLLSNHFYPANGSTIRFVTNSNVTVTRTLTTSTRVTGIDMRIGVLDSDVPSTLNFARVLNAGQVAAFQAGAFPLLYTDQNQNAWVADITAVTGQNITIASSAVPARAAFYHTQVTGDSSHPAFLILDKTPVIMFSFETATAGPSMAYSAHQTQVNSIMTTLGGGYQLTSFELTPFPSIFNSISVSGGGVFSQGTATIVIGPGSGNEGIVLSDDNNDVLFSVSPEDGAITAANLSAGGLVRSNSGTLELATAGTHYVAPATNLTQFAALTSPGADRLLFWDQSANGGAGAWVHLTLGSNLSITDTTLNAAGGGSAAIEDNVFGSGWNANTGAGPSKNAMYDYLHSFDTDDDGKVNVLDLTAGLVKTDSSGVTSVAVAGTDYLIPDAELNSIAILSSAADRLPYYTGSGTASLATFTSFARTLLDDAAAVNARTTLGLAIGSNVQAWSSVLDTLATGTGIDSFGVTVLEADDEDEFRANIDAQRGVQYKDESSNLGTAANVNVINFTGLGVTATRSVDTLTVNVGFDTTAIDTSAELRGIVTDENGTGALLFEGGNGSTLTNLTAANLTGTVADGNIAATIARDSEVAAAYQPIATDTDLASGTALSLQTVYRDTYAANRTHTFSGTPAGGNFIVLRPNVTTACTLTFPTFYRLGESASRTTVDLAVGRHELSFVYTGGVWLLADSSGSRSQDGFATLVAGTVTVSNTSITANTRILASWNTDAGTPGVRLAVTRSAGASFTLTSKDASNATATSDTSVIAYQLLEP